MAVGIGTAAAVQRHVQGRARLQVHRAIRTGLSQRNRVGQDDGNTGGSAVNRAIVDHQLNGVCTGNVRHQGGQRGNGVSDAGIVTCGTGQDGPLILQCITVRVSGCIGIQRQLCAQWLWRNQVGDHGSGWSVFVVPRRVVIIASAAAAPATGGEQAEHTAYQGGF